MQGKRGYQPIDESKINWQELEDRWGVKRDNLEKSGDLTKMLHYGKSDLEGQAHLRRRIVRAGRPPFLQEGRRGECQPRADFIRKEQKLDEYKEHKFSDDDRKNLRETGNLGDVYKRQSMTYVLLPFGLPPVRSVWLRFNSCGVAASSLTAHASSCLLYTSQLHRRGEQFEVGFRPVHGICQFPCWSSPPNRTLRPNCRPPEYSSGIST